MKFAMIVLFILSVILFWGTWKNFLDIKRPGVYPPKQILKKRAAAFAGGGGVCLLTAILISYFL